MSPALPVVSGKEIVVALAKAGFAQVVQRGSYAKPRDQSGRTVIVPLHRELARGTLSVIVRQAAMTATEFINLL
ncbi:MAG: type II toxin-antitoxin system HicA family toxin [Acidimicrobiales bacterium]